MGRKGLWKEEEEEDGLNTGHKTFSSLSWHATSLALEKKSLLGCVPARRESITDHRLSPHDPPSPEGKTVEHVCIESRDKREPGRKEPILDLESRGSFGITTEPIEVIIFTA